MVNLFKTLSALDLPPDEYLVLGSGILGALGLREINDVDLVVTPEVLTKLQKSGQWREEKRWGRTFLHKGDVELSDTLAWEEYSTTREEAMASAQYINGFPFLNIEETMKFKRAMGREKDKRDIALLEEYLENKK